MIPPAGADSAEQKAPAEKPQRMFFPIDHLGELAHHLDAGVVLKLIHIALIVWALCIRWHDTLKGIVCTLVVVLAPFAYVEQWNREACRQVRLISAKIVPHLDQGHVLKLIHLGLIVWAVCHRWDDTLKIVLRVLIVALAPFAYFE
jgi:hypothetical protein